MSKVRIGIAIRYTVEVHEELWAKAREYDERCQHNLLAVLANLHPEQGEVHVESIEPEPEGGSVTAVEETT